MAEDFSIINYPIPIEEIEEQHRNNVLSLAMVDGKGAFLKNQYDPDTGVQISSVQYDIDPEHVRLDIIKRKDTIQKLEALYEIMVPTV